MNQIEIQFFASLKELAGTRQAEMQIPANLTVAGLKACLGEKFPRIDKALATALVSINQEFAFDEDIVPDRAEVALFPPVSGGSEPVTIVKVCEESLDLNTILAEVTSERTGAACLFSGMVRGTTTRTSPHETLRLEYEAYRPMAEKKMRQIAGEIRARWPEVEGIAIYQRIGVLEPTTPTVVIACTAAHRDTGVFDAAHYGIDRLKEIVPIWKKEISPDGETWIEGDYHPDPSD